jgi:hypothetical protein
MNANKMEIKQIVNMLINNGYEFDNIREAMDNYYIYPNDAIAIFSKKLSYSDTNGDYINDSGIKISIQFEKRADDEHFEINEDGDNIYVGDVNTFIQSLIDTDNTCTDIDDIFDNKYYEM